MDDDIHPDWKYGGDGTAYCSLTMRGHLVGEGMAVDPRPEWAKQKSLARALQNLVERLTTHPEWHIEEQKEREPDVKVIDARANDV